MVLKRLKICMGDNTPMGLADKSNGDFSHMTIRRALAGRGIDKLKAKAIAKALKVRLEDLVQ